MPKFRVLRRVDAYVDYVAEVEANNPEEAAELANACEQDLRWSKQDTAQFDARLFVALDANGNEIESTRCGDI